MDIHMDLAGERWNKHSSIFPLFLCCYSHSLAPAAPYCYGWRLRGLIATGTEFAPSFPLFLWFSLDTQRHTCTKPHNLSAHRTALIKAHFGQCQQHYEPRLELLGLLTGMADSVWETLPSPLVRAIGKHLPFPFSLSFCFFFPPEGTLTRVNIRHQAHYRPC